MDLPSNNPAGYQATSPLAAAAKLSGRVLLIHGESDDNVHPSGTMRMAAALQKAGKDFDLMLYPGAAHAVSDPWQSWHLTRMTDQFLAEQLLPRAKGP
jgi:dipeptidyl-peptidase-4